MHWNKKRGNRKFSQVFLKDTSIIKKIADSLEADGDSTIVEIGPGKGALTRFLLTRSKNVNVIEIDPEMVEILEEKFSDADNLTIHNVDILKMDFDDFLSGLSEPLILTGNLPYDIGTAILMNATPFRTRFEKLVFMLQKEVIQRLLASPGSSEYGFISAYTDFYYEKRKVCNAPPDAFSPKPKVHSAVIELKGREVDFDEETEDKFIEFLKASFAQKRKTLKNNLKKLTDFDPDMDIAKVLYDNEIPEFARAEELTIEKFETLFRHIYKS